MKQAARHETVRSCPRSLPHEDNKCKLYLDKMAETIDDLERNYIFLHAAEAV